MGRRSRSGRAAQAAAGAGRVGGSDEALRERIKELTCLYEVAASFAEHPRSLGRCFERIAAALPRAMRFPEEAEALVRLDEAQEQTAGFDAVGPSLSSEIRVGSKARGVVVVGYRSKPGDGAGAPDRFLPEERSLLETVARQIGIYVEGVEAEARRERMEEQLRHADRLASIGQLAAGVAHELNEPLGNILGFAQLAQKAPDVPEQVRRDLAQIVRAAMRGREIIRKLLVFARQAPSFKTSTNLNAIVEDAIFLLEAGCENPGVRFVRDLDPALPAIDADPVQMRQIVVNLVINAIHAISGSGLITVRTRARGESVELAVEDTGQGMLPEVVARCFDPFFTTKDVGQGTGLGLPVVQGIVAAHGGTIALESEPGQGSRFTVRLPLTAPAQP